MLESKYVFFKFTYFQRNSPIYGHISRTKAIIFFSNSYFYVLPE